LEGGLASLRICFSERGEFMSRIRLVLVPLVVAGLSFGIAACGDDDDDGGGGSDVSDASFDLTVGALVPLTGDLSQFGPPGEKAADLAIQGPRRRSRVRTSPSTIWIRLTARPSRPRLSRRQGS
jgi:hypothetical protein